MTDNITLPRSVVEQALEALKYERDANNPLDWHHDKTMTALCAALEQPQVNSPEIPEGWRLVPVKPTEDMLSAVAWPGCAATDWEHMLSAAPQPPVVEQPQVEQEPVTRNGWVLREILFDNGEPVGRRSHPRKEQRMSKWDDRFLKMAITVSAWSKDPKRCVGAVIADADHRVVSVGYNGFPRGVDDSPALLEDSQQKLLRTLHAEANALLFAARPVANCTAYVTYPPCSQCAAMLIQAGIARVVSFQSGGAPSKWAASWQAAEQMMREAGVVLDLR